MRYRRSINGKISVKGRALAALAFSLTSLAGMAGAVVGSGSAAAASTPSPLIGNPYYMASPTGAVWPLGGAVSYGSLAGDHLREPIEGITLSPDRRGYWLVAPDGGVFSFGDAKFYGSTGGVHLVKPIVGMAPAPDGKGYWLIASDGGVFSFGDAKFYGSTGGVRLVKPIVGMTPTSDGKGYWLYASDGGVFTFGDAKFYGSLAGSSQVAASLVAAPGVAGYWEVSHDGDVYPFGSARKQSVPTLAVMHTILGPGDVAMEWAMAQLGKPYLWGGTGPNSFDCSGLVMEAWKAAGESIPRVAADQYTYGGHVAISQLQIGDLVFWASNPAQPSTIEHVAMYIGGGHMVNAPYTGQVIRTDWIGGTGFIDLGSRP